MHRRGGKRIRMDEPPPEYQSPEPEPAPEDEEQSPEPTPTKRVTRSRGHPGRLAESPPPPPPPRRRGRGTRGRGRGRGAAPPPAHSPPPELLPGDDETSLYNVLRLNKTAITQVVDMWIEQYKANREGALVKLMQFFINSSGCRGTVSPDMAQMDHTLIIKKMTQEFDEESGEYPLIMTGQSWKKFRSNFCDFVQTLVKMCQYSIIYDQYLMDNIISLLTGLSDSQVRAFRHTATLAVMKLMTALVDVALLTSVSCDNCQRQYEAERVKARDKRAADRLEVLVAKRQELEENMEEIKNMLSYMFKSVFVHRYRDTLADIRAITMSEIGVWMEKFPAHFLDDLYLKYVGWTLHDKVGEVRLRCLQALRPLYETDELKAKLELFTSKFKERVVAMSLDREPEVAVNAVRLVSAILRMHPDVLADKDCENVYELVYSSQRGVAQAAGEFLNVRLFRPDPAAPAVRSRRGKLRGPNAPLLRDLVQFFIESELHEHGAYLVDALIDSNPMMKDWETMTDLLLEEAGPDEDPLDNRQEASLVELMACCVRQAATGEPPVGRAPPRRAPQPSRDQTRLVAEDRARLTAHFIPVMPALLDKFAADADKLANLAGLPQHFDLELYTSRRQEEALAQLLARLRDLVAAHTEPEVLETCCRTLEYLCSTRCAIHSRCHVARATLADAVAARYKEAADDYRSLVAGGEEPDADETFNVLNSLRKLATMFMCHDLNDTDVWDVLAEDLPPAAGPLPPAARVYVVRACFFSLVWALHALEERPDERAADVLRDRLRQYAAACRAAVSDRAGPPELREEAYTSLCDLLLLFAEPRPAPAGSDPAPPALHLPPEPALLDQLNEFVQERVFVHHAYDGQDERRIEELHKRRNFLAAYCKLVVYSLAPVSRASDVFKHYIKCYNDYGDIIKATLSKAREMNKLSCALAMGLAMQALYGEMLARHGTVSRSLPEFTELKELAKRFSVMFGQDALKNREALTALHRAGVTYAARDARAGLAPNLLFLEPLGEFTTRLLRPDRRVVLRYLDAQLPAAGTAWLDDGAALAHYRTALLADSPDDRPPPARRAYSRHKPRGPHDDEDGDEHPDSEHELRGYRWRAGRLRVRRGCSELPRPPRGTRRGHLYTTPTNHSSHSSGHTTRTQTPPELEHLSSRSTVQSGHTTRTQITTELDHLSISTVQSGHTTRTQITTELNHLSSGSTVQSGHTTRTQITTELNHLSSGSTVQSGHTTRTQITTELDHLSSRSTLQSGHTTRTQTPSEPELEMDTDSDNSDFSTQADI